jgi:transcription elongation factor GreA
MYKVTYVDNISIYIDVMIYQTGIRINKGENYMSEPKQYLMTAEGIKKLEEELEYYRVVKRKEVTEKIKVALSFGDLSENAEYDEAKNDQAFVEGKIVQLESMLRNAVVVDENELEKDKVNIGSVVKVKDYAFDENVDFKIVGSAEANPMKGKISNESPVGNALMGKKVGDVIEVPVPDGIDKYEILEISRD